MFVVIVVRNDSYDPKANVLSANVLIGWSFYDVMAVDQMIGVCAVESGDILW